MKEVSYKNVSLNSGFLYEKQMLNKNVTIDAVYKRFSETGRIDAFNCNWKDGDDLKPHFFWDSDVAKWMEGASYILQKERDASLEGKIEDLIDRIEKNQGKDGYFNIYFTVCEPENRFKHRDCHELYCAGHLFEAAVAYYEATGRDRFLKLMEKYADYIIKVFMVEKSAEFTTPGHEEIELALIRMYRATGKKKYLELAQFFIDNRGCNESELATVFNDRTGKNSQSHLPVREQKSAEGHCVRACYLYSAMVDLAYETNDTELFKICKNLFDDIVDGKMYITGGIGSTRLGESFTVKYDLKNDKAYAETCAAISLMYFAHRMMQFENNAKYADIIERILFNGMISGLSLSGDAFFYENPLEIDLKNYYRFSHSECKEQYAITQRAKVFTCSCCPPNLNRVLASLGGYVYGVDGKNIYVNQFVGSTAEFDGMSIVQKADFPKSNKITIRAEGARKICVRIPSWCEKLSINADYTTANGYAVIENPEKEINITFDMTPFIMQANANVYEDCGKVAVCVGPFVLAAESLDNSENLHNIFIDKNLKIEVSYADEFCGFKAKVKAFKKSNTEKLYSRYNDDFEDTTLNMIPYAAFANRGESNMCVWFNIK